MIDINIEKAFYDKDIESLSNFKLHINRGEIVTIVGKSGCGKSSLLNIIASLHERYFGSIKINEGSQIGYIPQNKCLLPWKTVNQNIMLLNKITNKNGNNSTELLKKLGIYHLKDKYPNQLSGGEYQRTVLGQVFFYKPDIILMDEPFSALDIETKFEIMKLFKDMQTENSITTVFVTHHKQEADYMEGRVVLL